MVSTRDSELAEPAGDGSVICEIQWTIKMGYTNMVPDSTHVDGHNAVGIQRGHNWNGALSTARRLLLFLHHRCP